MPKHTLIIVRHAKAQDYASGTDDKRALTNAGKVQARKLGIALRSALAGLDDAFISPATRARQTWEALSSGSGVDPATVNIHVEPVIYSASPSQIWDAVRIESTGTTSIVVGHEPTVSELARRLLKEDEDSPVSWGMPTGSAIVISSDRDWNEWHPHCADLEGFEHVSHA
ncbi:histidine phosphatase family protein [Actinomycetaceae bacterium MB13-C1-2]|nr:histidine phosphatase family protein [Actinomycetaceae bacterium MB13-C1-2]